MSSPSSQSDCSNDYMVEFAPQVGTPAFVYCRPTAVGDDDHPSIATHQPTKPQPPPDHPSRARPLLYPPLPVVRFVRS